MIDFKYGRYSKTTLVKISNLILMYCFTKSNLENLLTGRLIRRMIKFFESEPILTIQLSYKIFKGVNIFKVNIIKHKKLKSLMNVICDYFVDNLYEKLHLTQIEIYELHYLGIKIAFYLQKFFNLEDIRKISNKIVKIQVLKQQNLVLAKSSFSKAQQNIVSLRSHI